MTIKKIIRILLITFVILLLPLMAMQFTDEVNWDLVDFAVAGALLLGAGMTYELIAGKMSNIKYRFAFGLAVMTAVSLIWVNLAVGIIGTEDNPANLMYAGVLAIGIIGSLIARFQPGGMAGTLFVMALTQMLVGVIALIAGLGFTLIVDMLFAASWSGSALLFRSSIATDPK